MTGRNTTSRPVAAEATLRLADFLPYRLSITSNAVSRLIATAYARRFDLSIPEWRLIAILHEEERPTQQQLVRRTLMDKVAVSRAAQALAERGLIERTGDRQDGRAQRLSLTPAGHALYDEIAPLALDYERMVLAGFSCAEVALLGEMLERLARAAADAAAGAASD